MKPLRAAFQLSFIVSLMMLLAVPVVHATSIVNVAGLNTPQCLLTFNDPNERWYTQSFTTLGDGLNLTTIVLPLTRYDNATAVPGPITAEIWPITTVGMLDPDAFAICSGTSDGDGISVSNSSSDIFWLQISVIPTQLLPATSYALVVFEAWTPYNETGFLWWARGNTGFAGSDHYAYEYFNLGFEPMPTWDVNATGNTYSFGFELVEGISAFTGVTADANLFLSLFLSMGLGLVGFGMSKGKEPLAAIFMMEFGVFISYLMGWLPAWILASTFAVLGIVLAYKFRGALHG